MELNDKADLDSSQVNDLGSSGGGGGGGLGGGGLGGIPLPIGGGKIGLIITVVIVVGMLCFGGVFGSNLLGGGGGDQQADNSEIEQQCDKSNTKRFENPKCRNLLYVNSIQAYWQTQYQVSFGTAYKQADTNFFQGAVNTGCGQADSGVGPFYCPADSMIYIDLSFYNDLSNRFGAKGEFAAPYVLAHEYGHHVQNLLGTNAKAQQGEQSGPKSASVRLELQADCYAGTWAKHATETKDKTGQEPLFKSVTAQDFAEAVEAAEAIGDDSIQKKGGGQVNPDAFTHGTSAQRRQWLERGFSTGDPKQCDTFAASAL